jgi:outer membrane protein assembly factor BamE (lipoprotein component of BamABCDE complex)
MRTAVILAAVVLAAAGCSKLTAENYSKLKVGMTYPEVKAILGSPTSCDDTAAFRSCRWGDEKQHVTVRFVADQLVLHSAENIR